MVLLPTYPYELKQTITTENFTDLEYQLLFIWKSPKDFGIDAWNGVLSLPKTRYLLNRLTI